MSTSLYRHFGIDGTLLYVGISLSWPARTKAHMQGSRWFDQVAKVEIEQFPTREDALEAEREAIKREKPKFNVIHNRRRERPPKISSRLTVEPGVTGRFLSTSEQKRLAAQFRRSDPLLNLVTGPDAIVGPPLVYRDDQVSIIIAHGQSGSPGVLDEIVLGRFYSSELPSYAHLCATVLTMRRGDDITIDEVRRERDAIVQKLRKHLRTVEQVDSDLSLALANASRFPSAKARKLIDELAAERRAA